MAISLNLQTVDDDTDWIIQSVQASLDGIWAWSAQSQQLAVSAELQDILGYGDLSQKDYAWWLSIIHPDDLENAQTFITATVGGNKELSNSHCRIKKKNNEFIKISVRGKAHKDSNDQVNRVAGSVNILEAAIENTNITVSNDLIGLIDNLTEKLKAANLPPAELESISNLSKLLKKNQELQEDCPMNFSVKELVDKSLESHTQALESKGLQVNTMISQKLPEQVNGKFNEICSIMQTIIKDACEKTEEGYLNIVARPKTDQGTVRFEFSDTRFPDDSTNPENMDMCQEQVEKLGGQFSSTVTPGSGHVAWFELTLPAANDTAIEVNNNNDVIAPTPRPKLKILLAEDNLVNQEVMKGLIAKFGDDMEIAQNGQEAVDMFKAGTYDLILMDINMPVMNGLEASKQIRELNKEVPIIAVTANMMLEDRNNCLEHGMNDVETKPINSEKLGRVLDTYGEKAAEPLDKVESITEPEPDNTTPAPVVEANIATDDLEIKVEDEAKIADPEPAEPTQTIEPTEPMMDHDFLGGLTSDLGIDTIKNLLGMYTSDAPPLVAQIKTEIVEAHTHAHTLAGMSENLGIAGVGKVAREIMATQSETELQLLVTKLNKRLDQALKEISVFSEKH